MSTPLPTPTTPSQSDGNDRRRGLSLRSTIGIGVGIAVVFIIIFLGGFICVRRRRKIFGKKRKDQEALNPTGDSPDEEIKKKIEMHAQTGVVEGVQEASGTEIKEIDGDVVHGLKVGQLDDGITEEVHEMDTGLDENLHEMEAGKLAHELSSADQPVEIGQGEKVVAELP